MDVRILAHADHQLLIPGDWNASLTALEATCVGLANLLATAGRGAETATAATRQENTGMDRDIH